MDTSTKSVAILGGAFDPVHLGHLSLAEDTFTELKFDEVWFVPTAQSPLKGHNSLLGPGERLELLEVALSGYPQFNINRSEIDRGGVSYTIDTVRRFNADFPDIAFSWIVGGDQLLQLDKWREIEELARRIRFVIVSRPGYRIDTAQIPDISGVRISEVRSRFLDIASSDIRRRIAAGKPVNDLLPKAVSDLILQRNFYRD